MSTLPEGWEKVVNPSTGALTYVNKTTGEVCKTLVQVRQKDLMAKGNKASAPAKPQGGNVGRIAKVNIGIDPTKLLPGQRPPRPRTPPQSAVGDTAVEAGTGTGTGTGTAGPLNNDAVKSRPRQNNRRPPARGKVQMKAPQIAELNAVTGDVIMSSINAADSADKAAPPQQLPSPVQKQQLPPRQLPSPVQKKQLPPRQPSPVQKKQQQQQSFMQQSSIQQPSPIQKQQQQQQQQQQQSFMQQSSIQQPSPMQQQQQQQQTYSGQQ